MNFKSILDRIFDKIKNTSDKKLKDNALNKLEERIIKNKIYKHQFEVLTILQEHEGKIKNKTQLDKIILKIRNKNYKFITENNITSLKVWQENKKLLEFYNINPSDIITSTLDKAIDINRESKLNEAAIKSFFGKVVNNKLHRTNIIKESFVGIFKNKSFKDLNTNFKVIRYFAESLDDQNKQFIFESLSKLRTMQKENFKYAVEKTYQLRIITEKLILKEFEKETISSPGKRISLSDLSNIEKIKIETPTNYKKPSKIILSFQIPFYPIGARYAELSRSALTIKNTLDKFGPIFINKYVKGQYSDLFSTDDYVWQIIMRETAFKIGTPSYGKVRLFLNTKQNAQNTWEDYYNALSSVLEVFNNDLPKYFAGELTPAAQAKAIEEKDPNRLRSKKMSREDQIKAGVNIRKSHSHAGNHDKKGEALFNGNDEFGGYF